jgi:diguanylate cyclase (GGDEF)-like protein
MNTLSFEQPRSWLAQLRFNGYLEDEFRQHYAALNQTKVRPLLMLAALAVIGVTVAGLYQQNISIVTTTFGLGVMLPVLVSTLLVSYQPERRDLYQPLLAASVFCVGLIVTSLTLRASLAGTPFHFAGQVAWIFIVWLVLGLLFWHAAASALTISAIYSWGLVHWNFAPGETYYEMTMLGGVNAIGALCCFQLEVTTRRAFRGKQILENLAERDGLTGLYNRRAFNSYMERMWRQSRRELTQLTVMLIDVDRFKDYNDLYGHQAGDDALKRVAEIIAHGAQRPLDIAARYGGEEFVLVLYAPAHDSERALPEQIRRKVEALAIAHAGAGPGGCLTVSIGVAIVAPGAGRSMAGAIQMADEALYQAKEEGRNCVVVKESPLTQIQTGRFRADRRAAG